MTVRGSESTPRRRRLDIITPSYAQDLQLCVDLNRTLAEYAPHDWRHHVIVPRRDLASFRDVLGPHSDVHSVGEFLPKNLVKLPMVNVWENTRHPWPPVRGWIVQQLVKLEAAARSDADAVLLVDSDLVFVKSINADTFLRGGVPALYRRANAIDARLPRHVLWHRVARELLGLPQSTASTLPDYICWPGVWSPDLVRSMLRRVEQVSGKPWQTAIAARLHFSEMILYGVFVEELLDRDDRPPFTEDMRCVNYSDERPLTGKEMAELVDALLPADVALMISAKSQTDLRLRRAAISRLTESR